MPDAQSRQSRLREALGIVAVSFLAYALCDLLHEAAHAVATLLPLGVRALSISTVSVETTQSSPVVAAAGSAANVVLGFTVLLSFSSSLASSWRYFGWLLGSLNLFNATGYLLYSAVFDSGDMAVVFRAIAPSLPWRPIVAVAGLALYAGAIRLSLLGLRRLVDAGVVTAASIQSSCMLPYWFGGLLLLAGAAFNPAGPWLILTSGAAVGFGAMAGLVLLPRLLRGASSDPSRSSEPLRLGWPWLLAGIVAAVVFVCVFGPGVSLAGG